MAVTNPDIPAWVLATDSDTLIQMMLQDAVRGAKVQVLVTTPNYRLARSIQELPHQIAAELRARFANYENARALADTVDQELIDYLAAGGPHLDGHVSNNCQYAFKQCECMR